jgi:hypothetical protein
MPEMKSSKKQKTIRSFAGIAIAIVLFFSSGLRLPVLDTTADTYFSDAITKAGLTYATCRAVNASISIVKESSLQLEPAGVGVSLAVGQALDPIDDMTERLSNVLVTAITSLGVQKLTYEISISLAPPTLAVFLLILSILSWFENDRLQRFQKTILRLALFIAIARFFLPMSSMANEFLNNHFFVDQISEHSTELAIGSAEIDTLKEFSLPEIDGIMGTIDNSAVFLKEKSIAFKNALTATMNNMGHIIETLLELMILYIGQFLIQVIILPLLSFWFLIKTMNALFNTNAPILLKH